MAASVLTHYLLVVIYLFIYLFIHLFIYLFIYLPSIAILVTYTN